MLDKQTKLRRRVLELGLLACYEIIDKIHRELAELGAPRKPDNAIDKPQQAGID